MKSDAQSFNVIDFNIDGFLKLSDNQIKVGGFLYFLQKNQIEFKTEWQLAIGIDLAIFNIIGIYEPTNKIDFSKLATYKGIQRYEFTDTYNLTNEKEEVKKVALSFHKELSDEYNRRIKGTKLEIPFPVIGQSQLDQFCQQTILSLHKGLERFRNTK